jgi:hypothetical protein
MSMSNAILRYNKEQWMRIEQQKLVVFKRMWLFFSLQENESMALEATRGRERH